MDSLLKHLQTLGLTEQATLEDAQAAYKDLIRVWHPDRFESDPALRSKAEAQTREINLAITEVRAALKRYGHIPRMSNTTREPPRQERSPASVSRAAPARPTTHRVATFPTLAIHQTKRSSFLHALFGLGLMYLGLVLIVHYARGGSVQTALGVVLIGHGFSTALIGLTLVCLKRPVLTVTQSFIRILGMPRISLFDLADSRMTVTSQGSSLMISCTPAHMTKLPIHTRWALKIRYLLRNHHFEFKASSLDAHPAYVIDMLNTLATTRQIRPLPKVSTRPAGSLADTLAMLCIGVALLRCLLHYDTSLSSLAPYLGLFMIFRATVLIQTIVLTPSR